MKKLTKLIEKKTRKKLAPVTHSILSEHFEGMTGTEEAKMVLVSNTLEVLNSAELQLLDILDYPMYSTKSKSLLIHGAYEHLRVPSTLVLEEELFKDLVVIYTY